MWIYISDDSEASVHADSNIPRLCNTLHLTLPPSPAAFSHLSPLIPHFLPCTHNHTIICLQRWHHYKLAWCKRASAPRSPSSSSDEGSGVKKGRSREGPITVQFQPHSATIEDLQIRDIEEMDRETGRKWHHPTPIWAASYWSIVLVGFVWTGRHIPSICTDLKALTEGNHVRLTTDNKSQRVHRRWSCDISTLFLFKLQYFLPD